ncbi:AAA family ATPase [Campylobacter upsaliensis]
MKIHIKNIGMLDEAEFEVGDLTLICGENNTGKTYATYSLYGYLDFMRNIRDMFLRARRNLFDDNEFLEKIRESQREIKITYEDILEKLKKHLQEKTKLYSTRILPQIMAGKEEDFSDIDFNVEFNISLINVKEAIKKYLEDDSLNRRYKRRVQHTIYDNGLSFVGLDKRAFVEYVETFLDAILHIIFMKNFILSVERTGASIFQEELDFIKIAKLETMQKMLKEEDISLFEINRTLDKKKQLYPKPVRDNIAFIRDIKQISKQESVFKKHKDEHKIIFEILGKIIGGKYKTTDAGILFQPKGSKKAYNIEIASSSVRSLLMLNYYILHIANENDILMIDEPELNLHPKNQILVARLLVLLVNTGIKVFITTHSDYIVRELSNCIMLNNLSDGQIQKIKKQGYGKEYGLESQKVKAYLAENIKGKNTLRVVEITQEQGIFMETFDESIDSQNENQGLIFEEAMRNKGDSDDK